MGRQTIDMGQRIDNQLCAEGVVIQERVSTTYPLPLLLVLPEDAPAAEVSRAPNDGQTEGDAMSEKAVQTMATILVVEDDELLLEFVRELLSLQGYRILTARNPDEANHHLENAEHPIRLIFSDIKMPGTINGIDLARMARQRQPDLQIILTTGFSQECLQEPIEEEFPILQKPYFPDVLLKTIRNALEKTTGPA